MVPNSTIIGIIISSFLAIAFPIALLIYYRRKHHISWKAVLFGALVWFLFTQVLEKMMHLGVLSTGIQEYPVWLAVYGGLAAGVFEEVGRFIAFRYWLKNRREYLDGVAYGIGHGGFEAVFIGVVTGVMNLVYVAMYNAGTLESSLAGKVPAATLDQIKHSLTDGNLFSLLIGGFERIPSVFIHIALSLLVLYGIRLGQKRFLGLAILLHAAVDFCAALFGQAYGNLVLVETLLFVFGVASVIFLVKAKGLFNNRSTNNSNSVSS